MAKILEFEFWDEAFGCCRKCNRPILVDVAENMDDEYDNYICKIFPSGRCEKYREKSQPLIPK